MKMFQLFGKSPRYKKFAYEPRYFDPKEEERKERERRISAELDASRNAASQETQEGDLYAYRKRMQGSFRGAKKNAKVQADPSANMLRLVILTVITVGLIAYISYGKIALYGVMLVIIPLYLYLKFRPVRREHPEE